MPYYVGLQIEEAKGHHVTLAFLGNLSQTVIDQEVIPMINDHIGSDFKGVDVLLDGFDMYGPAKNLKVRLAHFDSESESGGVVHELAKALYERYATKDYPQNFHISTTGNAKGDGVICQAQSVRGCKIYVKSTGKNGATLYSTPE